MFNSESKWVDLPHARNVDATAVAGPSSLPPKPVTTPAPDKQADEKKKRRPKRKRAPGSSTAPTEDGEASSSEAPAEVYSTPWVGELGTTEYESKVQRYVVIGHGWTGRV